MKDEQRITVLEDELKILKNEVKAVLLDLREQYLNIQNPFNQTMVPSADGLNTNMHLGQKEEQQETSNPGEATPDAEDSCPDAQADEEQVQDIESQQSQRGDTNIQANQPEMGGQQNLNNTDVETQGKYLRNDLVGFRPRMEAVQHDGSYDDSMPRMANSATENKKDQDIYHDKQVDLVVIAGLTQWLDQAISKLGKERTEVLIEISFTMGRLPQNLKDALVRMAHLSHQETPSGQSTTASDYLSILAQLDNLLSGSKQQDNALLSILSMMKDSKNG